MKMYQFVMNRRIKISFCFLVFLLVFSCKDDNTKAISIGERVIHNNSSSLDKILPICDSIFLDSCNVFYILTSPNTSLFAQGAEIDDLYYENCMLKASTAQEKSILNLMVHPDLVNIRYLKGVYIAFGLSYLNHSDEGVDIIKISDKLKFNKLFQFTKLSNNSQNFPKTNWIYHCKDDWYIVSGDLIRSGCLNKMDLK